jgi:hypothetical protein
MCRTNSTFGADSGISASSADKNAAPLFLHSQPSLAQQAVFPHAGAG